MNPAAVEAYAAGELVKNIAADFGISPSGVRYWVRKAGLALRGNTGSPRVHSREVIAALHAQGLTDGKIAAEIGTYRETVARIRYEMGLPANAPRGKPVDQAEVARLHGMGFHDGRIAAALDCSNTAVHRVRRDVLGLAPHPQTWVKRTAAALPLFPWLVGLTALASGLNGLG